METHVHRWKRADADEVYCAVCGIEPWQRDQLDVECEMARRQIARNYEAARQRLGIES